MIYPIVTLDKIYIKPDNKNIYFLDCTRLDGKNISISRRNEPLSIQIDRISKEIKGKKIILADDVIYSGSVLRNIINEFNLRGIEVVGVISSICTKESYNYFNRNTKYGVRCNYLLSEEVIDQICERDFYFGIAGSGIYVKKDNVLYKAPYFKPFGDPVTRASIPAEYNDYFSNGCIKRSILLWEEIDLLKGRETLIKELPEKIINTDEEETVVKTLRKVVK